MNSVVITILSGTLTLLAAVACAIVGLALTYRFVPVKLLESHHAPTGAIYAALYVMFGISLGFSLYLVWQQYESAKQTVASEADAVQRIYWLAEGFPDPQRTQVQDLAVSYARVEIKDEWPMMARGEVSPPAERISHQLAVAIRKLNPKSNTQDDLYADELQRFDALRENRALRLLEVREGIPPSCGLSCWLEPRSRLRSPTSLRCGASGCMR